MPPSFRPTLGGDVGGDLVPEMRVAAIEDQPVAILHFGLNIDGQLQRVHLAALGDVAGVLLVQMVGPFLHPFGAAPLLQVKPAVPALINPRQGVEKGAGIGEQRHVGAVVVIQLLMAAIHADQRGCPPE
jgi:hypothetical protein